MINPEVLLRQYRWRYAVREFDPNQGISPALLESILQSMVLAPSSFGAQPWKIYVVEDAHTKKELFPICYQQRQIIDSSHVLVLCGNREYSLQDIEKYYQLLEQTTVVDSPIATTIKNSLTSFIQHRSAQEVHMWIRCQVYILLGFALSSCAALGVDCCPMEGFISKEVDRILGLRDYTSIALLPLGIRREESSPNKIRFDLDQVVHFHRV